MQAPEIQKVDLLGRIERVEIDGSACARRVASGSALPGTGWVARRLLERERRALRALDGIVGVPREVQHASVDPRGAILRAWVAGVPLSRAMELPADFFDHLDALVAALHARGVCHNDLHKESNVLVGDDGFPWLVDFQLASVHPRRGRAFHVRAREDLRHVEKHRRRYTRHGRGPGGVEQSGAGAGLRRAPLARAWRRFGKPVYVWVTRRALRTRDGGDAQRAPAGPWPAWTSPRGPRADHRMSSR